MPVGQDGVLVSILIVAGRGVACARDQAYLPVCRGPSPEFLPQELEVPPLGFGLLVACHPLASTHHRWPSLPRTEGLQVTGFQWKHWGSPGQMDHLAVT